MNLDQVHTESTTLYDEGWEKKDLVPLKRGIILEEKVTSYNQVNQVNRFKEFYGLLLHECALYHNLNS